MTNDLSNEELYNKFDEVVKESYKLIKRHIGSRNKLKSLNCHISILWNENESFENIDDLHDKSDLCSMLVCDDERLRVELMR